MSYHVSLINATPRSGLHNVYGDEASLLHFKPETKTVDTLASREFSVEKEVQGCTFQGRLGGKNFKANRCTCDNIMVQGIILNMQLPQ